MAQTMPKCAGKCSKMCKMTHLEILPEYSVLSNFVLINFISIKVGRGNVQMLLWYSG